MFLKYKNISNEKAFVKMELDIVHAEGNIKGAEAFGRGSKKLFKGKYIFVTYPQDTRGTRNLYEKKQLLKKQLDTSGHPDYKQM